MLGLILVVILTPLATTSAAAASLASVVVISTSTASSTSTIVLISEVLARLLAKSVRVLLLGSFTHLATTSTASTATYLRKLAASRFGKAVEEVSSTIIFFLVLIAAVLLLAVIVGIDRLFSLRPVL